MKYIYNIIIALCLISSKTYSTNLKEIVSICTNKDEEEDYNYCIGLMEGLLSTMESNCMYYKEKNIKAPFMTDTNNGDVSIEDLIAPFAEIITPNDSKANRLPGIPTITILISKRFPCIAKSE
tara:strand:+ start:3196 stop:3564 length:369 start_codon:yes stop_codon:yes gene_type:complete